MIDQKFFEKYQKWILRFANSKIGHLFFCSGWDKIHKRFRINWFNPSKFLLITESGYVDHECYFNACSWCVKRFNKNPHKAQFCHHKKRSPRIHKVGHYFTSNYFAKKLSLIFFWLPYWEGLWKNGRLIAEPRYAFPAMAIVVGLIKNSSLPIFFGTVSTFSPQTGEGGGNVTQDGSLSGQESVAWATCREGGTPGDAGSSNTTERIRVDDIVNGSDYRLSRMYMSFNTGPTIDDGATINNTADTKLTLRVVTEKVGYGTGVDGVVMVGTSMAAPATLGTADWLKIKAAGGGDFGTGAMEENSDRINPPAVGNDATFDINAAGIANISKTGVSQFAVVSAYDSSDTDPSISEHSVFFVAADNGTTIPTLSVDWTTAVTARKNLMLLGIGS